MKNIKPSKWIIGFFVLLACMMLAVGGLTFFIDPLFHYRAPREYFYYRLGDERLQNDGIIRHFSYDALITGTSVSERFKTSEADVLFDASFIKVALAGGRNGELASQINKALETHDVSIVIRDLYDAHGTLISDKDEILGETDYVYPDYLYNDEVFDDINYLYNFDIFTQYTLFVLADFISGKDGGVTDFDTYGRWEGDNETYGREVFSFGMLANDVPQNEITDEELEMIHDNVEQNILSLARKYPETDFYYYVPPYSIMRWAVEYYSGETLKRIQTEEAGIKMLLGVDNIHVYSFNTDLDIVADLNNYRDTNHYGDWINSYILEAMADADSKYLITEENFDEYIDTLREIYLNYDYEGLAE